MFAGARICVSMPKSAWMAFVSHVLIEYVFTYFKEVYIQSEGTRGCFTEEKKLGFRLNIFTSLKLPVIFGALNLDVTNFNIQQTSDQ